MTTEHESDPAADETEPACKSAPPVDAHHDKAEYSETAHGVPSKKWNIPGSVSVGDCLMDHMELTLRADGIAEFQAEVSSDDDDDVWVFYGGISLYDQHQALLWTSPKLVGPNLGGATRWIQDFGFPVQWFDPAVGISINRAHC